ncbi:TPA: DUF2570 domain-containing protein [Escherichia coli]|uniref:DUF2570 domain-containing protein n=1 Tax=Escherichia coli TaxID=562 RepID=A0AB73QAU0_ECOLX|nr:MULTISPECIES: DUF2570 domain-containing protein [Enterobacteriaceae]ECF7539303.1 DUF2570 domain-containing protein [Salmonella enterica subsp. enterica]EDY0674281.1 DUF2570 domain-containing protein [Salmonella enterica subsp. enterica serovar Brancaster]ASG50810.1 DUF2570 domain-containing protein [Escherichia coli]EAA7871210.1 DUF2570 domain-containing protein [Salmonella enterica]EAQ6145611.1 DUF2570 domain-containing protein [Salmonella enterica]
MKLSYKLVIAAFFFTVIGSFIWSANHYYSKYQHEKKRADEAVQNAKSATVITNNVLQSLQIVNTVLEANQHAKQQITLESQRTENDIKAAVADDDCAVRFVPSGAVKRLHDYANGLRSSSGGSVTSQPDG